MPPLRVLIVDDDPDVRAFTPPALEAVDRGLDVRAVATVGAAWDVIRSWAPDVVLLDAVMPLAVADGPPSSAPSAGLRFLVERRKAAPGLAVLMHTGSCAWREACARHGADGYVVKPVYPAVLAREVREAVARRADR